MSVEIITTVTAPATAASPAGPYDLTDLATVHDELSIPTTDTSNDAFLTRAITQASLAIKSYCNLVFQVEGLTDVLYIQQDPYPFQVPGGVFPLQLSRWPLVTLGSVIQTLAPGTTQTLQFGSDFTSDPRHGWLIRLDPYTGVATRWEALPTTVTYTAGYTKTAWRESHSVPATPGPYTVNVTNQASFAADLGVVYASNGEALTNVASAPTTGQYSYAAGVYTFSSGDQGAAVLISYLYAAVPDDVIDATLRLVTARFRARGRDPMLKSQGEPGLGQEQYWIGPMPGQNGALPPEIQSLVDPYRVPMVA